MSISLSVPYARAAELAYGAGYVGEYSDNFHQTPTNQESVWIDSLLIGFGYQETGPEWTASVRGQGEYRKYSVSDVSNQYVTDLDASGIWTISPERLSWTAQDVDRQVREDVTRPASSENSAQVNTFSTGPDAQLHIGESNILAFGLRYGYVSYDDHSQNNTRYDGTARWIYELSERTRISLNFEREKVAFKDNVANNDYTQDNIYLRLDSRQGQSEFVVDAGETDIHRDRGADAHGTLARLTWTREITPTTSAGISAAKEYSNAGTEVLASGTLDGGTGQSGTGVSGTAIAQEANGDVYVVERGNVFYASRGEEFMVNLQLVGAEYEYEAHTLDRRENGGRFDVTYDFSGATALTFYGSETQTKYLSFDREDDDKVVGLRLSYRAGRNVTLIFGVSQNERESTDATQPFKEQRALLGLLYSTGPTYVPVIHE